MIYRRMWRGSSLLTPLSMGSIMFLPGCGYVWYVRGNIKRTSEAICTVIKFPFLIRWETLLAYNTSYVTLYCPMVRQRRSQDFQSSGAKLFGVNLPTQDSSEPKIISITRTSDTILPTSGGGGAAPIFPHPHAASLHSNVQCVHWYEFVHKI